METSAYAVSDETGVFIQLALTDAVLYPGEDIDRYVHMAVSLIAVIARNLDVISRQRKACLLVSFIKRARGMRLLSVFIEATCLMHILTKRYRSFCR